ncbi:MAG: class I SAM-dependent methyltransferase [Actinomycetota bacterium]|nr:class I SAM-dependent methyltransferase [Actinomycetota bacterium]
MTRDVARWHDLECGGYDVDLPLWRELAAEAGGPVLDVGAGTGRTSLDLARRGAEVTALDVEEPLLTELARRARAGRLTVATLLSDARELAVSARFAAIIVPMQTIQLLGGPEGRGRFLDRVRAHLRPGGIFAAALADALEGYDPSVSAPPLPDIADFDGTIYSSRPVAVVPVATGMMIERVREVVFPAGERTVTEHHTVLDTLTAGTLYAECAAAGLTAERERLVAATREYVGSAVVVCRG